MKGCQRKIYHVRKTESQIFEEAYFVLKKGISDGYEPGCRYVSNGEMAAEAARMVHELCPARKEEALLPKKHMGKAGAFALGAISSSAVIGTVALVLTLM